ncbi:MAG: histidinol-phosphate transaminase [Armatimonadota bacterium]
MSISDLVRANICRLKPYVPGKPIEEVEREYGVTNIIKLASNENPLGPSPKAVEAMKKAVEKVGLYPDGSGYSLLKALAKTWGVSDVEIALGNGSDDLIHLIGVTFLGPGDEVVLSDATFVRYESAAVLADCSYCQVPLKDHKYDLPAMADMISDKTRLIFIANPNNPTGTMVTKGEVEAFMERVPERAIVVFDEAYVEYVESSEYPDTLKYVREGRNVIVLHTFSKIYGLAGLRVGYAVARPEIIQCINQVREPFNVNSIGQVGALASLADPEQVERSKRVNSEGKMYLCAEFDAMGLPYAPSEANFVWVDVKSDCRRVFQELLKRGVIVRTGDIFGFPTFLRVTIGTADENRRFAESLREVLK